MEPLVALRGVSKGFASGGSRVEVLHGIDLTIERGELVAIVGYSGAGKTTLVSLIAGLLAPDTGTVRFAGAPVTGPGTDRGVVFQSYSLLPWLSVHENVLLAVEAAFPAWDRTKHAQHADRYVAMVGLAPARDKTPGQLSGGMRQRVAVARALAMEPELLILDEPLSALDALTRGKLQGELERICVRSGKTILLITNDVDEALLLADRIVPLGAGPRATLGPSFRVELPRPRDKRALQHDHTYKETRAAIGEHLLASSPRAKRRVAGATAEVAR
ncbi:ABC transporter ATP-binding protein [Sandaracinus amylolyticus]|uniref:Nitrate ABC transporter, ATP-binding protein n=1 Tax=Sandaracinus amylolyticus TaxID=927083 RepID=A0A0F6VZW7_9BACT|nr:ABC transporter ATP-binding protein [Sandaracinus amylolyticus]AKF03892.1 Nitrate ABC transporter, ATP-binding protein [Sandaracinus amylolyticus]